MKEASIRKLVSAGLSVILTLVFLMYGWSKIFPSDEVQSRFMEYGYDPAFAVKIGIAEIIAAILVLFPGVSSIGCLLIIGLMSGAIYTHVTTDVGSPMLAIVMLVIATALLVLRWPQSFLASFFKSKKST